ncbi:MAG: Na/Pi cotransporter family protein [Erysipelotrichaceae bacterium]|nr:Na/Pi cotransporter family protein [Erysipelotrichaceae bacterium]
MSITSVLKLFGGLALFLYGMRLMGDGLKESSSGTLRKIMESVTNNPVKAFLLGLGVTALIQSSTATIVITTGLVAAGILTLHQSLGIIVGANVGTTVTGQIIRLIDLDAGGGAAGILELFKPSTLAPVALIIGIVMIMSSKSKSTKTLAGILLGFGVLFTGLMNMTDAVDVLGETGIFEGLFSRLGSNPVLGYLIGATVAFILQSSSASVGILQAFSASGGLMFKAVYAVICGIFLGDCLTTWIVCSIGAKSEPKRVSVINVIFNIFKTVLCLLGVFAAYRTGLLNDLWNEPVNSGIIANTNTVFNLAAGIVLLPLMGQFEKISGKLVKPDAEPKNKYSEKIDALNANLLATPAMALGSCYDLLLMMFRVCRENIDRALSLLEKYDENVANIVEEEENGVDMMSDHLSNYLAEISAGMLSEGENAILNQYFKDVVEFERLSDLAVDIKDEAKEVHEKGEIYPQGVLQEFSILVELIHKVLDNAELAFRDRDVEAAKRIEPLEEVVDNLVNSMKENGLSHLANGEYSVVGGTAYVHVLGFMERISDMCSNIGLATLNRISPIVDHEYEENLLAGRDEEFNREYEEARREYIDRFNEYTKNYQPDLEKTVRMKPVK